MHLFYGSFSWHCEFPLASSPLTHLLRLMIIGGLLSIVSDANCVFDWPYIGCDEHGDTLSFPVALVDGRWKSEIRVGQDPSSVAGQVRLQNCVF